MDPNFPPFHRLLARVYSAKGMYREAATEWQKYQDLSPGGDALANLIYCYGRAKDRSQALHAVEMQQARSREEYVPAYVFALAYIGLDEKDEAFSHLEQAITNRESLVVYLKVDPVFDPLRSDPRFADLLRRMGLSQ